MQDNTIPNNRIRCTIEEENRNRYYQMHQFLFTEEFIDMSNDAKVLYTLLRDRHQLSMQNNWTNENNEVYLIFSRENMCDMLRLSKPTVIKAVKELKKYNLIQEERPGQGKANRIYLLSVKTTLTYDKKTSTPEPLENSERLKKFTPEGQENLRQNIKILHPNNNDFSKTLSIHSQSQSHASYPQNCPQSIHSPANPDEKPVCGKTNTENTEKEQKFAKKQNDTIKKDVNMSDYSKYMDIIKKNIQYDYLTKDNEIDSDKIDAIVSIMSEMLANEHEYIKINKEVILSKDSIKSILLKMDISHIEYIIDEIKTITKPIKHIVPYIKTCIINAPMGASLKYNNLYNYHHSQGLV